jgi:hypothetical protein
MMLGMAGDSFVGRVLGYATLHARRADFGQKVNAAWSVSERLLVFGHHGVLNGGRRDVTEWRSPAWQVLASSTCFPQRIRATSQLLFDDIKNQTFILYLFLAFRHRKFTFF